MQRPCGASRRRPCCLLRVLPLHGKQRKDRFEEKMEVLKERKRALVATVLGGEEGGALRLTEADVEELFAAI